VDYTSSDPDVHGYVFHGYVAEPTGYGDAARGYIHALHETGLQLSIVDLGRRRPVSDPLISSLLGRRIIPSLHLCHTMAPLLPDMGMPLSQVVALTAWETERIPKSWEDGLVGVREVWVPCSHNANVFARQTSVPVFRLPHPYLPQPADANDDISGISSRLSLKPDDFVFFSILEWQERKCPLGIIRAFLEAFCHETDVVLVIKTLFRDSRLLTRVGRAALGAIERCTHSGLRARVKVVTDMWPERLLQALFKRGSCYVSLHRGEGWGYPLFNAACSGTPVIATAYSGPLDYLDAEHHNLVRYRLVPVTQKYVYFSQDMLWADPDISHAAELMRYVYENREEALCRAKSVAGALRDKFSAHAVGKMAADRLSILARS